MGYDSRLIKIKQGIAAGICDRRNGLRSWTGVVFDCRTTSSATGLMRVVAGRDAP
jgi:hypothetical protein